MSRGFVSCPFDICAENTWNRFQAMLRYLYTDEIEFAPWGSTERRNARALEKISESYGIPKPSPKSVYRLADKVMNVRAGICVSVRIDIVFSMTYPS